MARVAGDVRPDAANAGASALLPGEAAAAPEHPDVLALAGGRAGQGTSTLSALLGILSAADGARVLLVDATGSGSIAGMLGVQRDPGPAVCGPEAPLEERLLAVTDSLGLLTLQTSTDHGEAALPGYARAWLRWLAALYPRYDRVVIDAGYRLETVIALCGATPVRILAVTTPEAVAVTATYALAKALRRRLPHVPMEVLLNCASAASGFRVFQELESATRLFLHHSIAFAGAIPEDPALREAARAGTPVHHAPFDSPVVTAVHQLGLRLRREHRFGSHAAVAPRITPWR
jgi:MinD-like ATPase involved in chromosome partitioning or flagellar assembly